MGPSAASCSSWHDPCGILEAGVERLDESRCCIMQDQLAARKLIAHARNLRGDKVFQMEQRS